MHIQKLFPVGMLVHDVESELADRIENLVVNRIKDIPRPDEHAPHATDFFEPKRIVDLPNDLPELFKTICTCVDHYQTHNNMVNTKRRESGFQMPYDLGPGFSVPAFYELEYWTQDYIEGDVHKEHDHGIGRISGIYWVRANENAGGLQFRNPNPFVQYQSRPDKNAEYSLQECVYKPVKGRMLIYPSYLKHEVLKSGKDTIRTTIAFNT